MGVHIPFGCQRRVSLPNCHVTQLVTYSIVCCETKELSTVCCAMSSFFFYLVIVFILFKILRVLILFIHHMQLILRAVEIQCKLNPSKNRKYISAAVSIDYKGH